MRIAVVSDTHGHTNYAQQALRLIEPFDVDLVLHCGDIGTPEIVYLFARWPTHFVFGNVDPPHVLRPAIEAAGQTCHEEFGSLELDGQRVAFLHSHDERQFRDAIRAGTWDMVCYGHTHVAEDHWEQQTLVLNPGALYRANPKSLAIVDLPARTVTRLTL